MRILVLCYEYPPIGGGGGRVARGIAEALAERGHEVRVQTGGLGWRSSEDREHGVHVLRTATGRKSPERCSVGEMGLYLVASLLPALRLCQSWKPDVIHAHFAMPTGVLAWVLHLLTGTPYVLTAHLGDVPGGVPEQTDRLFRVAGWLARAVWRRAAGATAVSDFVRELAERTYDRKVLRILNGVALHARPSRPEQLSGKVPCLVFLGRFNPQKNAPLLIDALAQVSDLSWRLVMIGDGEQMPQVQQGIARHALRDRVELHGWLGTGEVGALLDDADVLCMPSSSEGMPVAAVEALRHGLALAGTEIPGLRDVLAPGVNGLVAPVENVAAFAGILRELLASPELLLQLRQQGWDKAKEFDHSLIVDAYEETLRQAAQG